MITAAHERVRRTLRVHMSISVELRLNSLLKRWMVCGQIKT